jgi:hypothetical protein
MIHNYLTTRSTKASHILFWEDIHRVHSNTAFNNIKSRICVCEFPTPIVSFKHLWIERSDIDTDHGNIRLVIFKVFCTDGKSDINTTICCNISELAHNALITYNFRNTQPSIVVIQVTPTISTLIPPKGSTAGIDYSFPTYSTVSTSIR